MPRSHAATPKPSPLLVLVCLAVVSRLRPGWIAVPLGEAARSEDVSAEYLSRLCSRAIERFDRVLDMLTRLGRPSSDAPEQAAHRDVAVLRAVLGVATSILQHVALRKPVVRSLVVGAWMRLQKDHPQLTQQNFCRLLAIPDRTFRGWQGRALATQSKGTESPVALMPPKKSPRQRSPRRPRFGFDLTLPGIQQAADTTDLAAFGVPLKLIASQDVGGRDSNLFSSVLVDDHESAELVVKVLTEALAGSEGVQAITDQGTPYMAERTRQALDELGAEHAPQREGDPQGKATVERAFRTVKDIARPLLTITEKIAVALPTLRNAELAKATATVLLTALLRAYQAGARAARRADEARANIDTQTLARVARDSREQARADDRSARLTLARIHHTYGMPGSEQKFIRGFRCVPLPVLREAERAFAKQAHRDNIRDRVAYFGKLVNTCLDAYRKRRARERQSEVTHLELSNEARRQSEQEKRRRADPTAWLRQALDTIAAQWLPKRRALFCGGVGLGTAWLHGALFRLVELHGAVAGADIAVATLRSFASAPPGDLDEDGVLAVVGVAERELRAVAGDRCQIDVAAQFAAAILRDTGPPIRSGPPVRLRT